MLGAVAGTQPCSSSLCLCCGTGCTVEISLCLPRCGVRAGTSVKLKLLEKSKSGVRRANLKEKVCFVHVLSNPATHSVCFVLKLKLFSFSLPSLFFKIQCFIPGSQQLLSAAGYREGFLWKRGRDNGQFLSRKFVLSEREGALKYFNKNDVSTWDCCMWTGDRNCKSIFEQVIPRPPFYL